ncbi:transglutaminase-like cysteine peptidase [Aquibium sp. ELW1220]|uniref:transglutaminase-like cysteine peptidase n=1 Tax=Aquibium sp. ELW1220 TaxID=2976766 RepID=UPI0025B17BAC|nr:transglutaminase-like cysteine peptidase [Aquibium sp. ELW1220]MDN2581877.1 transglutaminase-like cysteine peptidase [Aquibium sp. ELW1220]
MVSKFRLAGATFALAAITGLGGAQSGAASAQSLGTGGLTSQPIGHYEFCKSSPSECSTATPDRGPVRMSNALWNRISSVNVTVNADIRPMSDVDVFGKDEVWAYPTDGVGDCEDYVLEKRRQLSRSIPLSNLLITVVRKKNGEGHAVLTVRADQGDFILDNLTDEVKTWDKTGYRFLKRQASSHTGRWVSLVNDQNMMVGSVHQ